MIEQQQPRMIGTLDDLFSSDDNIIENIPQQEQQPIDQSQKEGITQDIPETLVEEVPIIKTNYSKKIENLIDTGFVENFAITFNGEEVYLSDIDIKDEEVFKNLLSQIKEEKDKKLKENYISKEGLDETTQKLIEIKKAGGDITEIVKENVKAIGLLKSYKEVLEVGDSVERENLSISIVAQELRNKGLEDEIIEAQVQVYINKGELEDRANNILNNHLSLHSQEIENKRLSEIDRQNKEKEDFKNFKKSLNTKYKELGIPESTLKVLVENATKINEFNISNTDELYFNLRASREPKDIETFAKLNYFIHNPKDFEKWISGKEVTEAKTREILKSTITINTSKIKPISQKSSGNLDDLFDD